MGKPGSSFVPMSTISTPSDSEDDEWVSINSRYDHGGYGKALCLENITGEN